MSATSFRRPSRLQAPSILHFAFLLHTLPWIIGVPLATGMSGSPSEEHLVPVTTPEGARIWVEVADTPQKRARGLMFRESLAHDRGMLFPFPDDQHWTMWMKNTRIPLDLIWMDRQKRIVHVERNVPICLRLDEGCPQYQPNRKAAYVLEVAAGVSTNLKLETGVKLDFPVEAPGLQPPE